MAAGGNAYYLAKFAGIFGLDMQDIGAQQTGHDQGRVQGQAAAANDQYQNQRRKHSHGTIIGGITTSHVPAIGRAIAKGLQQDPYWKPFFDGFPPVSHWLAQVKPDVVVCSTTTTG
jgi:TPP-dependent pyruvate/acetoin dehydrogenase alpha subunit